MIPNTVPAYIPPQNQFSPDYIPANGPNTAPPPVLNNYADNVSSRRYTPTGNISNIMPHTIP